MVGRQGRPVAAGGVGRLATRLGAAADRALVGGKAAGLADAMAAGHPVPDAVVITTSQIAAWVDGDVARSDAAALLASLGGRVAVRSSAVAEDGAGASFAGQYESVLDVTDADALQAAVRRCVASAAATHVAGYAEHAHADGATRTAVLVQRMLAPDAAGVAFSLDPVTGADHVVVEAVAGVADTLLAGEVTGERWEVADGATRVGAAEEPGSRRVLDEAGAAAVAALCRSVAASMGGPADIEWAREDGQVLLLQARPITAVPVEPTARPPEGRTYVREPRFDRPVDPLLASVWLPRHAASLGRAFRAFGVPIAALDEQVFHGRVYVRDVPVVQPPGPDGPPPPVPVLRALFSLLPPFRRCVRAASGWDGERRISALVDDFETSGRAATTGRTRELRGRDLAAMSDERLDTHLGEVLDHVEATADEHFMLAMGTSIVPVGRLGMLVEEHLGWGGVEAIGLLQGYGETSLAPGIALRELAEALGPAGVERATADHDWLLAQPATVAFMDAHGHRATTSLARPTDAEDPTRVVAHLQRMAATPAEPSGDDPQDPRAHAHELEARAVAGLSSRPGGAARVERFRRVLTFARRCRPYNDETEFTTLDALGLVRLWAVEVGRRLAQRGVLIDESDVFLLELDEVRTLLHDPATPLPDLERRRGELRWAESNPAPDHLGPAPSPPPPVAAVPRRGRETLGAILWAVGALRGDGLEGRLADAPQPDERDVLRGTPGSPGVATGTVRVVRSEDDFARIEHGDVVVCPTTVASWSPIFTHIAGIVTEHGGPLSHPATLAREYGLPAVLAVPDATTVLTDGAPVTVDGGAGTVTPMLASRGGSPPSAH